MRSPEAVRRLAVRLPFSRFHPALSCFAGVERIVWRSVQLEVNPGEVEGYFFYFLGGPAFCSETEVDAIIRMCPDRPFVVFDVGANIGVVSLAVAAARSDVRIVAFEPDPNAADRFRRHLRLNPHVSTRVELCEAAVGGADGQITFFPGTSDHTELGSMIVKSGSTAHPVKSVRLDTFCLETGQRPDVLKIDVEAAELLVLQGMSGLPSEEWPGAVLVELHGDIHPQGPFHVTATVHRELTRRGYTLTELAETGERDLGAPEHWPGGIHVVGRRPS
jgi:FkbM family methyltransferase